MVGHGVPWGAMGWGAEVTQKVIEGFYPGISTAEVDTLAAETCALKPKNGRLNRCNTKTWPKLSAGSSLTVEAQGAGDVFLVVSFE